jgi:hypothetical protein
MVVTPEDFYERQQQAALKLTPASEINEDQLRALLTMASVAALRLAAVRWSAPRGRSREQVIDGIVAALHNPHINRGDDFRIALGHVRACQLQTRRPS